MNFRTLRALALAVIVIGMGGGVARAQAPVVNPDDILYILPYWPGVGASDDIVQAELQNLRTRLGPEGPYVKLGFSVYVFMSMDSWTVDITSPAAVRAQMTSTIEQIDRFVSQADRLGFPLSLMFLTKIRESTDAAQTASEVEDVRNMMWYADNELAAGWWTHTRYARKQRAIQEAYIREVGKIVAEKMALYPNALVAATGDGELELATERSGNVYADYSPFTVAEFRDWLRLGGLYSTGAAFAGQGYSLGARYAGDATPATDSNGDGHTLNGDFGTSFTTWDLKHFNWNLTNDIQADPKLSLAAFNAVPDKLNSPSLISGGFDPPRTPVFAADAQHTGNKWWDVWVVFKQAMLHRHNIDFAKWMTTDSGGATIVPRNRWYSDQIPADYIFGGNPQAPNARWYSSMSSLSTADISPYGSMGVTSFNIDFFDEDPPFIARTLSNVAPQIAARDLRWGLIEWHPGHARDTVSTNLELYRSDMALIEQYGPSLLHPFYWGGPPDTQIQDTGFETALKEMIGRLKDGRVADPRIATDLTDGATVSPPLALTGSALDLGKVRGSGHGPGMDRVDITVTPKSGGSPVTLTVTYGVKRSDTTIHGPQFAKAGFSATLPRLPAGQYDVLISGRSTVGAAATTSQTIAINVVNSVTASPLTLQFGAIRAGAGGAVSAMTAPQVITAAYGGPEATGITASEIEPWMQVTSGPATGQFTVAIVPGGIGPGTVLTGVVTLSATNLPGISRTVPITLIVTTSGNAAPFGSFDTPADGATALSGSIQVSGWALDDIGVSKVEIWRDPLPGEPRDAVNPGPGLGTGKIYIADAAFIQGARPDVEGLYPNNPQAHRAGWGYLMLSQGLYLQGNGTYTFYAFAYDQEGRGAPLGSKTVAISNATAVTPFGNIDQPGNGATVSDSFWVFGWALTPNATPTCTINNGSVFVSFDSGTLIPMNYGDLRPDIAAAFPGFSNGSGAGAAYYVDISSLSNGVHTVGLFVVDDCGRAAGIGSRFINVVQSSGTTPQTATQVAAARSTAAPGHNPVTVTRGQAGGLSEISYPNGDGITIVKVAPEERIEIVLPPSATPYQGYQVVKGERRALPIGSTLDPGAGTFAWQPLTGFLGNFELEFVGDGNAGLSQVRIVVGPSGRLVVDTPIGGSTVTGPFVVAGWALDLAGADGTGVDAVHVWAYPVGVTNAKPIFAGAAVYGGSRPDVGGLYGAPFISSAYDVTVSGLPAGTYDLVVYARSTATGTFDTVQVVRVNVR